MHSALFSQIVARSTIGVTIIAVVIGFFIPIPSNDINEVFFTIPLVLACAVLYIGAIILLAASLPKFKSKLRQAYSILIVSMLLIAFAQFLIPIAVIGNYLNSSWMVALQSALYPIAMICLYIGTRNFGKLLQIRGWSVSFTVFLISFVPVGALAFLVVRRQPAIVGFALVAWFALFAANIMWQAKVQAAKMYTAAMFWLALGLAAFSVSLIVFTMLQIDDSMSAIPKQAFEDIPPVLSGIFLLIGAYRFYNIGGTSLTELPIPAHLSTSIDIVVYAASLASNPNAIDPLLDSVRVITSASSGVLGDKEQQQLRQVYLSLEQYLAHQDPLRTYDIPQLREAISKALKNSPHQAQTFWPTLQAYETTASK